MRYVIKPLGTDSLHSCLVSSHSLCGSLVYTAAAHAT
jgi:hypothetical protein